MVSGEHGDQDNGRAWKNEGLLSTNQFDGCLAAVWLVLVFGLALEALADCGKLVSNVPEDEQAQACT